MEHKNIEWKQILLIVAGIVVIIVVGAFLLMQKMQHKQPKNNVETSEVAQKTPGKPEFSFDSSVATTWRQGPTDKVSMAIFDKDETTGCWMSIEHKSGIVDEAAELKKIEANWPNAGLSATKYADVPMILKTKKGDVSYTLHQYSAVSTTGEKALGGQEFAYFKLPNGYAKVQGYCSEVEKLATMTPALQAVTFNEVQ